MNRIFITGDTHGILDIAKMDKLNERLGSTLTRDDYVIICGDAGFCWDGGKHDKEVLTYFEALPWTTLFIDGNHENFSILNSLPELTLFGGRVHKVSEHIFHLMRGQVFTIGQFTFFTMGGAISIDKGLRTPFISWWPEEMPSYKEIAEAQTNLDKVNWKVDYFLTHSLDDKSQAEFFPDYEVDFDAKGIGGFKQNLKFRTHFCGHLHTDVEIGNNTIVVYNCIWECCDSLENEGKNHLLMKI